jgi:hypothetical protein
MDHSFPDSIGHVQSEKEESNKVKESRPDNGPSGRQNAGGYHRGYGISRIIHPVYKIKYQGGGYDNYN